MNRTPTRPQAPAIVEELCMNAEIGAYQEDHDRDQQEPIIGNESQADDA